MNTAWFTRLSMGILGGALAACTVTATTDGSGNGGNNTAGGSTTIAGSANGGNASTAGGSSAGGNSSLGGSDAGGTSAGAGYVCDTVDVVQGTPADTCAFPSGEDTPCHNCLTTNCCSAVEACFGTDPNNQCWGGPDSGTREYECFETCMIAKTKAGNGQYDPDLDPPDCAGQCAASGCMEIGSATNDIIACMLNSCDQQCFIDPAK